MLGSKSASTPMDVSLRLQQQDGMSNVDSTEYMRLIGKLIYLTTTRPDITFVVQQLSQYMTSLSQTCYQAVIRVLRYLNKASRKSLYFPRNSEVKLTGFTYADWATCKDSRSSISRYCFFLVYSLISWKSKKQVIVAKSSSKAEYRALVSRTCELQWLVYLFSDLHISFKHTPFVVL